MGQEWRLYEFLDTIKKDFYDQFKKCDRTAIKFSGKIARRPQYFLNNCYLLMCNNFIKLNLKPFYNMYF
jgi:hypothetical protein